MPFDPLCSDGRVSNGERSVRGVFAGLLGVMRGLAEHPRTSPQPPAPSDECQGRMLWLYSRGMNEAFFAALSAWLTQAGLAGTPETDIVSGFCDRCVAAGLPLARALMFVDTLHPVHEGHLFRWGYGATAPSLLEYGRTSPDALAASG